MDNKLSELKAAAAKYSLALKAHRENPTDKGALYAWDAADGEFFALINNNEMEIIIALLADLEAKDKRIAELEAKLATPVRLPETYSPEPWMGPDPSGTWLEKEDVKDSIRAAGFTVGDE
ncbi:hypothetical protein AI2618V1_1712 [Serratia marcescens]|uniref:hypothetical protein n=1 Tax=Serratia TaxID=613 RepID=UPI0009F1621E|nr:MULTISPECIES: hypothetical protein [Serratia]EME9755837.1 hypothetical protein [Serratia marcescens]MDP8624798.1 hypothetical protein [Serratia marcescens]MDP8674229.1 hypothetical protein [Serratia marcescens]MDP8689231.1 hypothetical protein [Serratia marcescens]MDP8698978.1 hypothetical protein [Serratia marcescens]